MVHLQWIPGKTLKCEQIVKKVQEVADF